MVLAGGRSRRMGKDKALLPTEHGQPLLQKIVQTVQPLAAEIVVVTPWPERYQDFIPEFATLIKEPPPSSLLEPSFSAGPLSGFAYGWQAISSDWCLLLACDLPFLETTVMQHWWDWLITHLNETDALLAPIASLTKGLKDWEPLCGYYHRRCIPSLTQHLQSGQHSFQSWLSEKPIVMYQSVPKRMLFNCNTPNDWATVTQQ